MKEIRILNLNNSLRPLNLFYNYNSNYQIQHLSSYLNTQRRFISLNTIQSQYGQQNKGKNSQDVKYLEIPSHEQGSQTIRNHLSLFHTNYISHEEVSSRDK